MGSKFCVKFQRAPLKFHTKFWTHTLQNMHFSVFYFCVWVTISLNCDIISLSETGPWCTVWETKSQVWLTCTIWFCLLCWCKTLQWSCCTSAKSSETWGEARTISLLEQLPPALAHWYIGTSGARSTATEVSTGPTEPSTSQSWQSSLDNGASWG